MLGLDMSFKMVPPLESLNAAYRTLEQEQWDHVQLNHVPSNGLGLQIPPT